jgi:non-lysosomal glucosylceramidase
MAKVMDDSENQARSPLTSSIGHIRPLTPPARSYHLLAEKAKAVYDTALWNGRYFDYDSRSTAPAFSPSPPLSFLICPSTSSHHDSIMADMLAGQWYSSVCNLPRVGESLCRRSLLGSYVCPSLHRESTLCLIDDLSVILLWPFASSPLLCRYNVQLFSPDSPCGAVNGMRPNGTIDMTCLQSREVQRLIRYLSISWLIRDRSGQAQHTLSPPP